MEIKTDSVDIKYEIGDDIGRGKFATVKRCRDRQTGSEYAAKFIRKSRGTGRRGAKMENIEKEIQILSETNHRNIINLYEVYDTKREVILILELVDGGELFEYLSEKDKLCEEEASSFVKQILEGVEHLHSQYIAHLDLKPENILLQDKNSTAVKLIDFGLSRKILPKEEHRAIMGTAEFCAPEVISFEPLSVSTDMWSIGVITYVLLSGLSPFLGDNQQETYHNITSINFEFDEEYFNGTSDLAKDFIQKLLVKDTRKRATIHQCLNHPWIKPVEKRDKVLRRSSVINTEHLKKFIARQRWKRSMKVVSLCNRLSRSMQLRRIMSSDTIGSTSEEDKAENFVQAALFCASEEGNVQGIKSLTDMAQKIDLTTANRHGETAVHMAASGGHTEVIKFLNSKGVDIGALDKQGDSAVYWAARQGHVEVIKYLLDEGVALNSQNKSGETAAHVAARYGHMQVIDYLASSGVDLNVQDNLGETALHNAAWHGFTNIVHVLCRDGAKLDMQNKDGDSALHCAAARGHVECVKILLEAGMPLDLKDKRGCTALYLACNRQHTPIALMLLHSGCSMDEIIEDACEYTLHCAVREGLTTVVQTMCAFGCKVDVLTKETNVTPLHLASKGGYIEMVRTLLLSGAQSFPNKDGVSPEIMALAEGYTDIADLLNKVKGDRGEAFIKQLMLSSLSLPQVKVKFLGSTGVGKSTLIETLKCGLFSSFFRRSRLSSSSANPGSGTKSKELKPRLPRQYSLPTPLCYSVGNPQYTKGINIQHVNITGVGELSMWDFSGYEPYYMLYDHFLGETGCVHVVMFSLMDPFDEQIAQVFFWLNFLKARVTPLLPLGYCGQLPNRPCIILIASHADKAGCLKNARGEYVSHVASSILSKIQQKFRSDLDIVERVFVMDTQVAMTPDVKALKHQLYQHRANILRSVGKSSGFLEAMLMTLPSWRRSSSSYPVLSWQQFIEFVRSKVNPLVGENHIKHLVEQLQIIGEIVYLEKDSGESLVVLNPKWLCCDIIGNLISHEKIVQSRITGCFTVDEFQIMYPETDALDLLNVLEALEVCTRCENDDEIEYEFPCLNFVETLNGLWLRDLKHFGNAIYGGLRMKSTESLAQLKHIFPRIQTHLRRNIIQESDDPDSDLYQWHHGSKYCCGDLEGMISMDRQEQFVEIKVRGPPESATALFYFLEDFVNTAEQVISHVTPGLCFEKHALSPSNLKDHIKNPHCYTPQDILMSQLNKCSVLTLTDGKKENYNDVLFLGSTEAKNAICSGVDLPISFLPIHARQRLCQIMDPQDPLGRDWCLLAVTLGLETCLPSLDANSNRTESKTERTLEEWLNVEPSATVGQLITKLQEFNREDAVAVLLHTAPLFRTMVYDEHSTDESAVPGLGTASTNTLSNLSR
ncbi:death-associated protein kinase 1-like isoform X1 [Mercenaria mercenaria]|uniref:death-associated protein kinase 1-like isoform X1 n=1 Tax=Mercenaria mercenaria TaxID=6596 RepID=UPI00234EE94D|nr:death-associated protein kinase 1-like isoform X1 [Mercenaria mercenaria]